MPPMPSSAHRRFATLVGAVCTVLTVQPVDAQQQLEESGAPYLAKPFDIEDLADMVAKLLRSD